MDGHEHISQTRPLDPPVSATRSTRLSDVPWQIWLVTALLAVEGVGNAMYATKNPTAWIWLGAKVVFITGLLRGWRVVFIAFVLIGAVHVLAFAVKAPFVAFINLAMVGLVMSALRFTFPKRESL